MLHTLVCHIPG